jgi:hypothetical protein
MLNCDRCNCQESSDNPVLDKMDPEGYVQEHVCIECLTENAEFFNED